MNEVCARKASIFYYFRKLPWFSRMPKGSREVLGVIGNSAGLGLLEMEKLTRLSFKAM